MKLLKLSQGKFAKVDDSDFKWLSQYKWCYSGSGYTVRRSTGGRKNSKILYMHKVILNTPDDMMGDHINRDKLDNRRANLRNCTASQNAINTTLRKDNSSGFRGVTWHEGGKKWMAQANIKGKHYYLGLFTKIEDAINMRDSFAEEHHGEFVILNAGDLV